MDAFFKQMNDDIQQFTNVANAGAAGAEQTFFGGGFVGSSPS